MANARKDPKDRALRKGEIYQKSRNMYVYTFTDPMGNRQYLYSRDLMELREKETKLLKDQLDGLDIYSAGKSDINFVFDRYIMFRSDLRQTTRSNYIYTYDHYVRGGFGKRRVGDIKYSDVLYFYTHLMEEDDLSISTIESVHSVLSPTFALAERDDLIRKNPCIGVLAQIKKTVGKSVGVRHALTLPQQRAFLDFLRQMEKNHRWLPIFTVLLGTGCRVGEVIGLRWEDVDFESGIISINHTLTYYPRREDSAKCEHAVSVPKTESGVRTIPMLPEVREAFMMEKDLQDAMGIRCESEIDGMTGFIFCNRFGKVHTYSTLNRAIRRITDDYNSIEEVKAKKEHREAIILPHFSCHHLRHTFCTRICESETNIKVIQSVMGHKDVTTTLNIYADIHDAKKVEAFKELSQDLKIF